MNEGLQKKKPFGVLTAHPREYLKDPANSIRLDELNLTEYIGEFLKIIDNLEGIESITYF